MKALSLTQPWPTLIALNAKRIETRSWPTRYRGLIAIHAAKGLDTVGGREGLWELFYQRGFRDALAAGDILNPDELETIPNLGQLRRQER